MTTPFDLPLWCCLGSGGHTTELHKILDVLQTDKLIAPGQPVICFKAESDRASALPKKFRVESTVLLPRLREVGGSWILAVYRLVVQTLWLTFMAMCNPPSVLIVNGPGTCVPIVFGVATARLFAFVFRWIVRRKDQAPTGAEQSKILYFESFCRTRSLSVAAKVCLPLVDRFVVHWPGAYEAIPKVFQCKSSLLEGNGAILIYS